MTTVVLGDFNEWFWPASLRGALGTRAASADAVCDVSVLVSALSSRPYFLLAPDAMRASFVDRSARIVSDHLPVVADIQIC